MRQDLFHTFVQIFLVSGLICMACTSSVLIDPDGGSEEVIDGDQWDGDSSNQDENPSDRDNGPDGGDVDYACEATDHCPEGYRCKNGRCVLGWTVTSIPGHRTYILGRRKPFAVDHQGDVYLAGTFRGEIDFDPGPGEDNCSSAGGIAGFLLKLNSRGEYIRTVVFSGTSEADELDELSALAIGPDNDVYIGGVVGRGTVDVDPGPEMTELSALDLYPFDSLQPVFIVRLAPDNSARWVHAFSSTVGFEMVVGLIGIEVVDTGEVITAGFYSYLSWEEPSGISSIMAMGTAAAFVRQITTDGEHVWTVGQQVCQGGESTLPHELDAAQNDGVFVVGYLTVPGSVDFDPGPGEDSRVEGGNYIWLLGGGGAYLGAIGGICRGCRAHVTTHTSGGFVAGCCFKGEADLDPGPGVDVHQSTDGGWDSYVTLVDSEFGLSWPWVSGLSEDDMVTAIASDDQGRIYLAVEVDEGGLLVALTPEGVEIWRREFPGVVESLVASNEHGLYLDGIFYHEGDFDPGPGEDLHSPNIEPPNQFDTFVTRLTAEGTY